MMSIQRDHPVTVLDLVVVTTEEAVFDCLARRPGPCGFIDEAVHTDLRPETHLASRRINAGHSTSTVAIRHLALSDIHDEGAAGEARTSPNHAHVTDGLFLGLAKQLSVVKVSPPATLDQNGQPIRAAETIRPSHHHYT
ncbi:MAG: hypothetical protein VX589_00510 [Myxococcota bacterium]|nr:hypothetical protein [Myxococcota bacterium]